MQAWLFALPVSFGLAAGALAAPITYSTSLSGAAEFPPVVSSGTGTATVDYDPVAHTLAVSVTFSGLTGTTTMAHIHCCVSPQAANPTAGVATQVPSFVGFPTGVTSGSYSQTFDLTQMASWNSAFITANGGTVAGAEAALAAALAAGEAYFNIHTSFAGGGEIRGFLTAVPEPALAGLLGLAGLTLLTWRRRRARV